MTTTRRSRALFGALAVCLIAVMACAPATSRPSAPADQSIEPKTIRMATVGIGWSTAPEMVAQEKGFYADEKLTVEANVAGASAATCQQILAKAADIGQCSLNDMVQAVEAAERPLSSSSAFTIRHLTTASWPSLTSAPGLI